MQTFSTNLHPPRQTNRGLALQKFTRIQGMLLQALKNERFLSTIMF